MGIPFAPTLDNIFMYHLELAFLLTLNKQPYLYKWYIDDIFIIWTFPKEDFDSYFSDLNQFHPIIKYEYTMSDTSIDFLDLTIFKCTHENIHTFLKRYAISHSIRRKPGSGHLPSITAEIKALVEQQMQTDDETTAFQLHKLLVFRGYKISAHTVLHCRKAPVYTFRGSAYCQLICDVNKAKRLAWVRNNLNKTFDNVIWTD